MLLMKFLILVFFYMKFAVAGEIVEFYKRTNLEYKQCEEINVDSAICFMNENLNIRYPDYSKNEKGEAVNFFIIFDKDELNDLKQKKSFPTACWQAAVILRALTASEKVCQSFSENHHIFKGLNNTIRAALLGMVYISPPLEIMQVLLRKGVKTHQGCYMLLTSKTNKKYASLCDKMENLLLEEWQIKYANIWKDIGKFGKNSEYLKQEPDYFSLKIEEINAALGSHGGIECLTDPAIWQVRLIEISLVPSDIIRVSLTDITH